MEYLVKRVLAALWLVLFLAGCALVLLNYRNISNTGVALVLLGLAGIILSLWGYNRRNR